MNKQHKHSALKSGALAVAALAALMTTGNAATLFTDDFTGMTTGSAGYAGLNADGWYFTSSGGTPFRVNPDAGLSAPLSGNALQNYSSSGTWTYGLKQFAPTTLSSNGDYITLSLDFQYIANVNTYLYIALLNSGTTVTADDTTGTSPIAGASGYGMDMFPWGGVSIGEANANATYNGLSSLTKTGTGHSNLGAGGAYSLSLTLLKVSTGTQISLSINGSEVYQALDTVSPYVTFNTFQMLDAPNGGGNAYVDNVSVVTSVPEPSTVALLIAGGAFLLLRRRAA